MKLAADDELRRHRSVWVGPKGFPWPFTASYLAWWTWTATMIVMIVGSAILPGIPLGPVSLVWYGCLDLLITIYLMDQIDHDKPIRSLWRPLFTDLTGPRAQKGPRRRVHVDTSRVYTNRGFHSP